MDYLLGIDLGTSGAKTAILDLDGNIVGTGQREYGLDMPQPGWAEQDPVLWVQAAGATARAALAQAGCAPTAIAAIGLDAQMHTAVCLDRGGAVLRPAITWADRRSSPQVAELYQRLGRARLAQWTQNPVAAGFTLPTLLWLQENEPDLYARIGYVLLPKDYLRYYLTGEIGTEASDASATSLMDVAAGCWSEELLDLCGISPAMLPAISASTAIAGRLQPEAAQALGLAAGIPVIYGCADQPAQAISNAVFQPGTACSAIGTGGQLHAPSTTPAYDPELRLHTYCHALPGLWYIMAATLSAGLSFAWLRRTLGAESYAALADAAAQVPPGAEGLYFLPYLAGERTPHMDAHARGVFAGLTLRHGPAHLARAVMEGVVFSLRQGLELIKDLGVPVTRMIATGGATRHPLWLQLQADIYNADIYHTRTQDGASFGAALLAGVGVGAYASPAEAAARAVRFSDVVFHPVPANLERYDRAYRQYVALYPALREHFAENAEA